MFRTEVCRSALPGARECINLETRPKHLDGLGFRVQGLGFRV